MYNVSKERNKMKQNPYVFEATKILGLFVTMS